MVKTITVLLLFLGFTTAYSAYFVPPASIVQSKRSSLNIVTSSPVGSFTTTSTTAVPVTNLSVSITTTGRPVYLITQGTSSTSNFCLLGISSGAANEAIVYFARGASAVSSFALLNPATGQLSVPLSINAVDTPAAGTYTYTLQAFTGGSGTVSVGNCVLVAYEL